MLNASVEMAPLKSASSSPMPVGHAIDELLRALSASRRQGQINQDGSQARLTTWSDEDYHYIEAGLGNSAISYCDINIIEGKAFIRIVRENDEDDNPPICLPILAEFVPIDVRVDG